MQYMLLISEPRGQRAARTAEEGEAVYGQMLDFAATLQAQGVLLAGESLLRDDQGVRVQVRGSGRDKQARLLDGPFSETKEMVGGFFLVDCASMDDAVALATRCPAAEWATVEVRPLGPCFA